MKANKHSLSLLALQCVSHAGLVSMFFWANWGYWLATLVMYFVFASVGASVTYHRLLAHKSFSCSPFVRKLLISVGHLALVGSAVAWVAGHRQHHAHSDKSAEDLHSPRHHPWWKVLWLGMFEQPQIRFAKDLLRDTTLIWWHKHYFLIHVVCSLILLAISPEIWACAWLAPQALTWSMGSALNTFNHVWGYRSHNSDDESRNNRFFGYLFWGEGWHNNHHHNPKKWNFGERWWEIDPGAWVVKAVRTKS